METKTFNDGLELSDVEDSIFISVKQLRAMNGYMVQTTVLVVSVSVKVGATHSIPERGTATPQIHLP